jgi:hypothetical protein
MIKFKEIFLRNICCWIFSALVIVAFLFSRTPVSVSQNMDVPSLTEANQPETQPLDNLPFHPGEIITYHIKKFKVTAGEATLQYHGLVEVDGVGAVGITFTAKALNFLDEEKIYLDPKTFYPLMVKRTLDLWGKKERIDEVYDHSRGEIKIVKTAGGKTTEQIIKREGQIDNIYAFIYRYRASGGGEIGDTLDVHLPTKDVSIKLTEKSNVETASGKKVDAYFLQSDPKQYQLWISTSEQRIPLRIDGAVGLGKTMMVMSSYEPGASR